MKKLILIIIGFFLFTTVVQAQEETSKAYIPGCMDNWSVAFDVSDARLKKTLEDMMKQNKKASSILARSIPQILRTRRCELKQICKAAELKQEGKEEENPIIKILGCEITTLKTVETKFAEDKLNTFGFKNFDNCAFSKGYDNEILLRLYRTCDMHADYKIEQLKILVPALIRKDANRKQMGFLAFKIYDLNKRLEEFHFDLKSFSGKFTHILDSIKCVVGTQCMKK